MAQVTDYNVPNTTAANVRSEINDILGAVKSSNSSSNGTSPTSPSIGMLWYDGNTDKLKIYNGVAWQTIPYMPSGSMTLWAGVVGSPPTGWLTCKGQSLSKTTYADLFAAIAYTYGGSGNNFNLPDLQGRVPVGEGTGTSLSGRTLAAEGGAETHQLTIAEMPSHDHDIPLYDYSDGGVSNLTPAGTDDVTDFRSNSQDPTGLKGSNTPHNNMQPFIVMNYIIKI